MTKKVIKTISITAIAMAICGGNVANAATESANSEVEIIEPLNLIINTSLNFATVIPGASDSSMRVNPDNGRLCAAPLTCSGQQSAGSFTITGSANAITTVSHDGEVIMDSGSDTIRARLFDSGNTVTLDADGNGSFSIGGELFVSANQAVGSYTGNYSVSVDYQ